VPVRLVYNYLFIALWIAFIVYWRVMAASVKTTARLEPTASRVVRVLLIAAAIVLWIFPPPVAWLRFRVWPSDLLTFWVGVALTFAGLVFTVWARVHLGRNWSSAVTVKQDHELIVNGPYALVRHPIYSGLFVALLGTVLAVGKVSAVVAFALFTIAQLYKLRLEEKWMREQFGATYVAYSSRVAALVPFVL
jgi:protein-S-isoprenylcysteine O-methyltransferase Ste14